MKSLQAGGLVLDPPVVLAPMAGITNRAFRRLCRESGAGLYVSEMVTSRALVERNDHTMVMASFEPDEYPRSVQLYGVDPQTVAAAVKILVSEDRADHIDLNMGCPVAKVTRKGGGAALPWKKDLFSELITAAVQTSRTESAKRGVTEVPVTVKMRKGIDDDHLTFLDAGRIAADAGVAWVALHARTAAQLYGGEADWPAIAELVEHLAPTGVPVLGNGDIWTGGDAVAMMDQTGCAGVVVGRGCLGRPWLFGQLADAMAGLPIAPDPDLAGVLTVMRRHAELLTDLYGEDKGCRDFRKHVAWYLKGFAVGSQTRRGLGLTSSLAELDTLIAGIDADQAYLADAATKPRGRTTGQRKVALPEGWLNSQSIADGETVTLREAELSVSGG
ncbi:MAG: tRNA dihydrouridine synthase DusB [Actinobacteria bacterium]|nr:tRNA dihydrouridine synthase DusB [Actinomycetota bacterium]